MDYPPPSYKQVMRETIEYEEKIFNIIYKWMMKEFI